MWTPAISVGSSDEANLQALTDKSADYSAACPHLNHTESRETHNILSASLGVTFGMFGNQCAEWRNAVEPEGATA